MSVSSARLVLVLAVLAIGACKSADERAREAFLHDWLTSIEDDSPFFRQFVHDPRTVARIRSEVRPQLGARQDVRSGESYNDGTRARTYEYGVTSTKKRFLVFLTEVDHRIVEANILGPE